MTKGLIYGPSESCKEKKKKRAVKYCGSCSVCFSFLLIDRIFECIDGSPPYIELPPLQALFKISNEPVPATKSRTFPSLETFVGKCLIKDAAQRPAAEELLKDDFLSMACEPKHLLELCDAVDKAKASQPFNY